MKGSRVNLEFRLRKKEMHDVLYWEASRQKPFTHYLSFHHDSLEQPQPTELAVAVESARCLSCLVW